MTEIKFPLSKDELKSGTKTEVFCNKCGMSCRGHVGNLNGLIEQKVYINEVVNVKVHGGYDSTHLKDGDIVSFSLCERCLIELISTFQLHAVYGNYLFPEPYTRYWEDIDDERKWKALAELDDEHILSWFSSCEQEYLEAAYSRLSVIVRDEQSERDVEIVTLLKNYLQK